ncbi:TetR/AcrR family transcriptional regulator C-terminal domain-containing protein [Konateibacter massiliensis]|uniref:TetR/AcrR family transcriptional regulator C-terminal domain-containing protein n=1 Tax=Konateibacter massiliensis TaxID=2002841 RepID=UPI000C14A5EE|nr:TetR/AcrR family transcriptional regulator C-terminal domain-containing protein [Konateibacter massiliensis]
MKHEVTSLNTKKTLAASLKKQVSKKPFSKVTVSEIINDCGVNRKTFYYHFTDIYALLKWTLELEAIEVVKQFDLIAEYEEAVLFVMDYVEENTEFLQNIYYSVGRDELKRFFCADFIDIVRSFIEQSEKTQKLLIPDDFKIFLSQFYTEAIAGMLVEWIVDRSVRNREKTVQYISVIIRSAIPNALHSVTELSD